MTAKTALNKVPFSAVELTGGLWKELMDTNRTETLALQYRHCRKTGRLDALKLKWKKGCDQPHVFWDSDIAKWIEAAAYSLASHPDRQLERKVDAAIRDIEKCQMADGYLNTHFQMFRIEQRWTNLRYEHELYCAGHLMEAAVAYYQATDKRRLLDVIIRYADHIDRTIGPKKGQLRGYPGHEEIEIGLIKLYEATGQQRYLQLATFFVNERGQQGPKKTHYFDLEAKRCGEQLKPFPFRNYEHEYNQSHLPVRQQKEVVGHAVRALYLYSGMADVAVHTGDAKLLGACKALWKNLVTKRMAITGGVGPVAKHEGMTCDYDLPTEGAYLETCAAIALVFWAHRLFLATGEAEYLDVMERALYNGTISAMDRQGANLFYGNPLAAHPGFDGNGVYGNRKDFHYRRSPWFSCACCPPNLARMIAQFPGYLYAVKNKTLYVGLYTDARASVGVGNTDVTIVQETDYPWDGKVEITLQPSGVSNWTLALRIPAWCRGVKVQVNGQKVAAPIRKGFMLLKRRWTHGDTVQLELPMPVEQIAVHPQARQVTGQVAIQRGAIVYCLEEVDNGPGLANVFLKENTTFNVVKGALALGGVPCITANAFAEDLSQWRDLLYAPHNRKLVKRPIKAIPYFLWANRRPGEMSVFLRRL